MGENREYVSCPEEIGNIHIAEDVLAVIAAAAAQEVDGVAALAGGLSNDLAELVAGKKLSKGVRIQVADETVTVGIAILVRYGYVIPEVAKAVQESVLNAVENTSGLTVESVNVHVTGISFPR